MSNAPSIERLNEVAVAAREYGYQGAADHLGISRETVRRYVRRYREINGLTADQALDDKLLRQIREKYTDDELRRIAKGTESAPYIDRVQNSFQGDKLVVGALTDTHLGSVYTDPDMVRRAFDVFDREGVTFIAHTGDVHEGLSNRPGHVYECSHYGYSAQLEHSREIFGQWTDTDVYLIDGNHDRWFIKSSGAKIVEELCRDQGNLHFLGHDEADIEVGGITIKLWHGEDGNSYALSYRLQKILESLSGGEKPNVLLTGHTHKSITIFERNVHTTSLGCIQRQSKWMRGKRISAATGFYVITIHINEDGVARYLPEFYPFYV